MIVPAVASRMLSVLVRDGIDVHHIACAMWNKSRALTEYSKVCLCKLDHNQSDRYRLSREAFSWRCGCSV